MYLLYSDYQVICQLEGRKWTNSLLLRQVCVTTWNSVMVTQAQRRTKRSEKKLLTNKEQPGRYRWAKVRVGVGSGLIIRAWATGSEIHIISFPIVFKLFFITDQRGSGVSGEVGCCRRVVRTWPETRGQNVWRADFDSISPCMEPSTFSVCPLIWSCSPLNNWSDKCTWCPFFTVT